MQSAGAALLLYVCHLLFRAAPHTLRGDCAVERSSRGIAHLGTSRATVSQQICLAEPCVSAVAESVSVIEMTASPGLSFLSSMSTPSLYAACLSLH